MINASWCSTEEANKCTRAPLCDRVATQAVKKRLDPPHTACVPAPGHLPPHMAKMAMLGTGAGGDYHLLHGFSPGGA